MVWPGGGGGAVRQNSPPPPTPPPQLDKHIAGPGTGVIWERPSQFFLQQPPNLCPSNTLETAHTRYHLARTRRARRWGCRAHTSDYTKLKNPMARAPSPPTPQGPPPPPEWGCPLGRPQANGEGRCPPPCGPDTGQWHRDSLAPPPEGTEGGVGEVRVGQAEGEGGGHEGVRGRWRPPPAEGEGSREGQGVSGERPIGAGRLQTATQLGVMPTPPPLPPTASPHTHHHRHPQPCTCAACPTADP